MEQFGAFLSKTFEAILARYGGLMCILKIYGVLGGSGVLPQKFLKVYSSNGAIWGISEQNFESSLAKSGALSH